MSDRFDQYYLLQNQAKKMEQSGNIQKAIELFSEVITSFQPYDDYAFDRLSVLLEKSQKFSDSIEVCNKAIDKIKSGDIKGDAHKFEERLKRLQEKKPTPDATEKVIREKEIVHLHLPFLSQIKGIKGIVGLALYAGAFALSVPDHWLRFLAIVLFMGFIDYFISTLSNFVQNKRTLITMTICLVFLTGALYASYHLPEVKELIALKENEKETSTETIVKESAGTVVEDPDAAIIDDVLLEKARKTIELEPAYENCQLSANENTVTIELIVKAGTSADEAERIFKKLAKNIGSLAAEKGPTPPSDGNYGGVYDTYTMQFSAIDTFDTLLLEGSLHKSDLVIKN